MCQPNFPPFNTNLDLLHLPPNFNLHSTKLHNKDKPPAPSPNIPDPKPATPNKASKIIFDILNTFLFYIFHSYQT